MSKFTHLDEKGRLRMVDVSEKPTHGRRAVAAGSIAIAPAVIDSIKAKDTPKGNVLEAARLAGILAAKRTGELIPLCHPLPVDAIQIDFDLASSRISARAEVKTTAKTGVEMEAMTAVTVALLTIYDMCKALDKEMVLEEVFLLEKEGGKSGHFRHPRGIRPVGG